MNSRFQNFITGFKAEQIKKKGTGYYWTSAIMGAIAPLLYFTVRIATATDQVKSGIPQSLYSQFFEECTSPFANFFFPLLIIITASRITQIDHKNGGWQLMEMQPLHKFSIYFSKFATLCLANLLSIVTFVLLGVLCATLLPYCITLPKTTVLEFPTAMVLGLCGRLFIASLSITSIQYVLSVQLSSFIWSILIGIFGLLLSMFLTPFQLNPVWSPYEILSKVASNPKGSEIGHFFLYTEYLSFVIGTTLLILGFEWYRQKRFATAFFSGVGAVGRWCVTLALGLGLSYWLLTPNQMSPAKQTVIEGHIKSNIPCQYLVIRDYIINDTIAYIPIQNNQFRFPFRSPIIPDYYECIIDGKARKPMFLGNRDSIYMDVQMQENEVKVAITGTRLAENQMKTEREFSWSMVEYELQENVRLDEPMHHAKAIYEEWKEELAKPIAFRTADNYIAQPDYIARSEKLVTTKFLNLWNTLVQKRKALFPNKPTPVTPQIKEMMASLSLTDESLLSDQSYFDYVVSQLIAKNTQDIEENQKAILEIAKLKPGSFRDKMLFWQLRKSLEDSRSTAERTALFNTYQLQFTSAHYQSKMTQVYKEIQSLSKGQPAPDFQWFTVDGAIAKASDYKGKFLMIDVWATWCGPCKQQAPYFEKMALKYRNQKIQFVSLSIDEDNKAWYIAAKAKSKSLLQAHAASIKAFTSQFNVESIPRFILIDPNGKFVNARLPQPQDAAFETVLRKALGLPDEE